MASTSTTGSEGKHEVMGAFDGIAPSESASASKRLQTPAYGVFINHRGPDVKHTLATVLYRILTGMALSVFLDSQELEYGDFLPRTIEAAMKGALVHIAIFSERYAESPWCLAELSFMLKSGATIIPIFYHVDPSDLRYIDQGKGMYAKAFKEHEQKGRYRPEDLEEWKKALFTVSFYSGEIIRNNEDEMRLLKNIGERVWKIISDVPLKVAKHPVGLKEIVQDFEMKTLRSAQGDQVVQIVGICGMGGSGKTTLAKELYNKISSSMERSSFVFDVRDAATKGLLHEKQKTLLKDFGVQNVSFDNIEKGKEILSKHLRSVRVLIVLDDVDHVEQLDALLPTKDGLERDSLIIVTTRAYDVLRSWDISSIYKMRPLAPLQAEQLFCWHAFLKSCSPDGFKELVKKFLKECNGLPLSLKVFGSHLRGESCKEYWESMLHKISIILPDEIKLRLKISYDALDDEEKEMFLDTACFFIGEESSLAFEVWNRLEWHGLSSWQSLLHKCLVELDDNNRIKMHDHLRDLGRDIANQQSPYRLWCPRQIIDVQKQQKKRIGIRGIKATSNQIRWNLDEEVKEFIPAIEITREVDEFRFCGSHGKLMVNTNGGIWSLSPSLVGLKFLVIRGDYFNQVMGEVSGELLWLRWFEIGQRNLPSGLSLEKLRVLELYEQKYGENRLEKLWWESDGEVSSEVSSVRLTCFKSIFQSSLLRNVPQLPVQSSLVGNVLQLPVQLRELRISRCHKFKGLPKSIGHLKHLKKIEIIAGYSIRMLPDEFCLLQLLEHLVLYDCKMLSSLPSNFGNLRNLRHLSLARCRELTRLPVSFKNLTLLEHLNLGICSRLTFTPEDLNCLENITKLQFFSLSECKQLEVLPHHITNQASLRELYFSGTGLRELPDNIGRLSRLREMRIEDVLLTSLPTSLGDLSSLTNLSIYRCRELECLPDSLGDLSTLTNLSIHSCRKLECLPDSLGDLSSLTNLEINGVPNLECLGVKSLQKSIRQLNNLRRLKISYCPISELDFGVASLPFGLSNLMQIHLYETEVCRLSFSEDCCPHLTSLSLRGNHHLEEIEALPSTVESMDLFNCKMLKNIPSFARLTSLRKFELLFCYRIEKIEGLENCTRLESLEVETCWEAPGIESLEHMKKLRSVELRANKGSAIERCIRTIQKWPDKINIRAQAVPDAPSLVDSLLFPNLEVVRSSNRMILCGPKLAQQRSSNGDAIMFCFIINCVSSKIRPTIHGSGHKTGFTNSLREFEKGRWAWVGAFTQRAREDYWFAAEEIHITTDGGDWKEEGEVEKVLVVRGEEKRIVEAIHSLLPIFQI